MTDEQLIEAMKPNPGTFARLDADAPTIPPDTCPLIDSVQRQLNEIAHDLGSARRSCEDEIARRAMETAADALVAIADGRPLWIGRELPPLENLRAQNEQLRAVGKYWRNACDEIAYELDQASAGSANGASSQVEA